MVRKPSSLLSDSTSTSRSSSQYPPSVLSSASWDADDDDDDLMSIDPDEYPPPRPASIAVPKAASLHNHPYTRRPTLREILANTSEPPWTLAAFMAYLSNNHCLETLEFTMDAGRYRQHYAKMLARAEPDALPSSDERQFVQKLWEQLVEAYIQAGGPREVNLPSNVRDPIIRLRPNRLPPSPDALDPAVAKIHELMEESLFVPFLNSVWPRSPSPNPAAQLRHPSDEDMSEQMQGHETRTSGDRVGLPIRGSPVSQPAGDQLSKSYSPPSAIHRKSAPLALHGMSRPFGAKLMHNTSNPARSSAGNLTATGSGSGSDINMSASGSGYGMTDDSASNDSPSNESPTTPPTSPPLSDTSSKSNPGVWKRFGLSAVKNAKKKSGSSSDSRGGR